MHASLPIKLKNIILRSFATMDFLSENQAPHFPGSYLSYTRHKTESQSKNKYNMVVVAVVVVDGDVGRSPSQKKKKKKHQCYLVCFSVGITKYE